MNNKIIIYTLGIFVVILGIMAFVYFKINSSSTPTSPSTSTNPQDNNNTVITTSPTNTTTPTSTTTTTTTTPITTSTNPTPQPTGAQKISLSTKDGTTVLANDFIHNGITLPDASNPGQYLLAGNLGYCIGNPSKCQAAPADNFIVTYFSEQKSFNIGLTKKPVGQARLDMESFMLSTLGVTQNQLCNLNYLVITTSYVDPKYSGQNLKFSFCPDAVKLP